MGIDFSDSSVQLILGLLSTAGAAFLALIAKRSTRTDTITAVTDSALRLLNETQEEMARLRARMTEVEHRLDLEAKEKRELLRGVQKLIKQVLDLGHAPVWTPDSGDSDDKKPPPPPVRKGWKW